MDLGTAHSFLNGLIIAATFQNLVFCVAGIILGTAAGVLPGIGSSTVLAIILPFVAYLPFPASIVMMLAVYYGCQYGGSTTAILTKVAGEVSSIPTIFEGHLLALKGQAGTALSIAALASFAAGIVSVFVIVSSSLILAELFLYFGPWEFVLIGIVSMIAAVCLSSSRSFLMGSASLLIGSLFGLIGFDITTGERRFTFNQLELYDGIGIAIFCLGMFGLVETFKVRYKLPIIDSNFKLLPSSQSLNQSVMPMLRGTAIGSIMGLLPGSAFLSSFVSYMIEKKLDKKKQFGNGAIAGVAGPESANNASAQVSFVPPIIFGIPINGSTALILSACVLSGIVPGTNFIKNETSVFWILTASMLIGNLFLLLVNLPLVKFWILLLKTPPKILNFFILSLCCFGAYWTNQSYFEILLMLAIAILSYFFFLAKIDTVPAVTGFVLAPAVEDNLRRALSINDGNILSFFYSGMNVVICIIFVYLIYLYSKNKIINT